jgi:cytochrome oxidase Cu insertion factor (SCO1/SenC/PrrC family)
MHRVLVTGVLLAALLAQDGIGAADSFKPFKLKALEGPQRSLSDVLGKATLVVFFFPTCQFCNASFPGLQKMYDEYKPRGLSMVWINVVPDEAPLLAAWRASRGYTVPVLLGGRSVQDDYRLTTTPTHYLLDSRGQVLSRGEGYTPGDEKALEQDIRQALAR